MAKDAISPKNVLWFLLISAHRPTQSNLVSKSEDVTIIRERKSIPTHGTATFSLYNHIKTATHSLNGPWLLYCIGWHHDWL